MKSRALAGSLLTASLVLGGVAVNASATPPGLSASSLKVRTLAASAIEALDVRMSFEAAVSSAEYAARAAADESSDPSEAPNRSTLAPAAPQTLQAASPSAPQEGEDIGAPTRFTPAPTLTETQDDSAPSRATAPLAQPSLSATPQSSPDRWSSRTPPLEEDLSAPSTSVASTPASSTSAASEVLTPDGLAVVTRPAPTSTPTVLPFPSSSAASTSTASVGEAVSAVIADDDPSTAPFRGSASMSDETLAEPVSDEDSSTPTRVSVSLDELRLSYQSAVSLQNSAMLDLASAVREATGADFDPIFVVDIWRVTTAERLRVLFTGLEHFGTPYMGLDGEPIEFDCSGLTLAAWKSVGVELPHWSAAQQAGSIPADPNGPRPADMLFYEGGPTAGGPLNIGHVGLVFAPGFTLESTPSNGVWVRSILHRDTLVAMGYPAGF